MRSPTERAPTRARTRRGIKAVLASLVIVPTVLALMPGAASAEAGGNPSKGTTTNGITVTDPNTSECPGGGLKLDGINDKLVPNGTYSNGGLTIVITESELDTAADPDVLSFHWEATTVPTGKVVSGVVVKAGSESETELGGISGDVIWETPPWYSHISFCLTGVNPPLCPNSTQTMPTMDQNGDGFVDADDCEPKKCPADSSTEMSGVDNNRDGVDDACQAFCPDGTTPLSGDMGSDDVDDACQDFCPDGTTPLSGDMGSDDVDDACQDFCPDGTTPLSGNMGSDDVDDACQSFCPDGTTPLSGNMGNDDTDDACQSFCPGTTTVITDTTDANTNGTADMCETSTIPVIDVVVTNDVVVVNEPVVVEVEVGEVLGESEVAPQPAVIETVAAPAVVETVAAPAVVEAAPAVIAASAAAPQLAYTGIDTASLLQVASGLIGTGALLTRFGRKRSTR